MPNYRYLIIGGGMTADAAIHGIREVDPTGSIGVIGAERQRPYDRPPLSKGLWKDTPVEKIWRPAPGPGVEFHLGREARSLDLTAKFVIDDQGKEYAFEKLLLATGGTPRRLPFGHDDIIYFRTFDDYERLRSLAAERRRFAVIGAGFIGSEIAAALAMNGREVTLIFPGEAICGHIFPGEMARFINDYYGQKGVHVLPQNEVRDVGRRDNQLLVKVRDVNTSREHELAVDSVVAGIGIDPNTGLAQAAGLRVENGIVVDELLHTSNADAFAAGDVANFHNPQLGKRIRVEHEDNANTMGRFAGRSMAGGGEPYRHLPFFYSDLFELGYEAVGEIDSRLESFSDWEERYEKGVIYYLRDGRIRGVLLWNVWGQVDAARRLIAEAGPYRASELRNLIPKAA